MMVAASAQNLWAVETKVLRDDTFADFNQGESTGTEILAEGKLRIGPLPRRLARTDDAIAWKAVLDRYDKNIFVATGHEGKVWRVEPDGKTELWADLEEVEATALAVDFTGAVLVGTSPGGKIYRVAKAGKPELFFDTKEQHVWDLIFDRDGVLYAATGTSGKIFRIRGPNNGEVYYDAEATNVMGLAFDGEGKLLAATQGKGLVLRIQRAHVATVLYAAQEDECRALTVDQDGNIYVAVNSARTSALFDKLREERPSQVVQAPGVVATPTPSTRQADSLREALASMTSTLAGLGGQSSVVRIEPSGFASTFWNAPEAPIHALIADPSGRGVFVAAGSKGKLYRLEGDTNYSLVADVEEQSILSFTLHNGEIYFSCANRAAVYALSEKTTTSALFASRPLNAGCIVAWGNFFVEGDHTTTPGVQIELRTGNTADPSDKTWSEWKEAKQVGANLWNAGNPVAQYLQYRMRLQGTKDIPAPVVDALQFLYVQRNAAPIIKSVKVEKIGGEAPAPSSQQQPSSGTSRPPDGAVQPRPDSGAAPRSAGALEALVASAMGREGAQPQSQPAALGAASNSAKFTISWDASDPNGDKLVYRIGIKSDEEQLWKFLEKDYTSNRYTLDASLVPDGWYQILIEASDRPQNSEDTAASASLISRRFAIDNTPPELTNLSARKVGTNRWEITATARDAISIVASASFCVDTEDTWYALLPLDNIFDSEQETFRFTVTPREERGEHVVRIRVTDREGNARVGRIILSDNQSVKNK
jgi:sugar lactone lactonase YvrE